VKTTPDVLAEAPGLIRRLIADKGFDSKWSCKDVPERNATPITPGTRAGKRRLGSTKNGIASVGRRRCPYAD